MFTGLTKQEQYVLLALIGVIAIGLGLNYLHQQKEKEVVYIEKSEVQTAKKGKSPAEVKSELLSKRETTERTASQKEAGEKIDINQATMDDLMAVPRIGPAKAEAIIKYREKIGGFKSMSQLDDVPGVGKKTVELLQEHFYVKSPDLSARDVTNTPREDSNNEQLSVEITPALLSPALPSSAQENSVKKVNINTATLEELCTLEGIGVSLSRAIIRYREEHNGFKSIEELKNVYGIGEKRFEANKHRITVK